MLRTLPSGEKEAEVEEFMSERLGYERRPQIAHVHIQSGKGKAEPGQGETQAFVFFVCLLHQFQHKLAVSSKGSPLLFSLDADA